jgi:anti-anti-sigma factor
MELNVEQLAEHLTRISLVGRWDLQGAATIDLRLTSVAGSGRRVILDMAGVTYLSSMGLRSLVMSAKSAGLKGGKLVLLSPIKNVEEVLKAAGLDQFLPIFHDLGEATHAVRP